MINEKDLLQAIEDCFEVKNPNANTCYKLASFYTILDHIREELPSYSNSVADTIEYHSDTEFGRRIQGKDVNEVMELVDDLMNTIEVLHPRLYQAVINRL